MHQVGRGSVLVWSQVQADTGQRIQSYIAVIYSEYSQITYYLTVITVRLLLCDIYITARP